MGLASPTKQSDQEHYLVCAEILEATLHIYKKTTDEERKNKIEENIQGQVAYLEQLKEKLANYDYSADDKRYWALEALFKKFSPGGS